MKPVANLSRGATLGGLLPQAGSPVFIRTENYAVKSLASADIGAAFTAWLNDPAFAEGMNSGRKAWTLPEARQFYGASDNRRMFHLGLRCRKLDQLIGFYTVKVSLQHQTAELFAAIGNQDFWGRGVIQETAPALLAHFFGKRSIAKVTCRVLASNRRMFFNLARASSFVLEARLRSEARLASGQRVDVYSFASFPEMLRGD